MKFDCDLIIVGGGSAGLSAAETGALFRKKIVLISEKRLGGDCLWTGCVPSKVLLHAADRKLSWTKTRAEIDRARNHIQEHHDNPGFYEAKGIQVILEKAKLLDQHTILAKDQKLTTKNILIATGSSAFVPPISGLDKVHFQTNETIFDLEEQPKSLIIIGGGPIGCELAQAFRKLGSTVHLIQRNERLIPKDEPEASQILLKQFEQDGINVYLKADTKSVKQTKSGIELEISQNNEVQTISGDTLLVAIGRVPNIQNLGLEDVGVKTNKSRIEVNLKLQTSVPNIYAAGDVAGTYQFTHFAGFQGAHAVQNMFLPFKRKFEPAVIPWVTFTNPEIAHVGKTAEELTASRTKFRAIFFEFDEVDRAVADGETNGFIKLYISSNLILGATIVCPRAGELIHEVALAISNNIPINKIIGTIHAYPTYSSGIQQALLEDFRNSNTGTLKFGRLLSKLT